LRLKRRRVYTKTEGTVTGTELITLQNIRR
jgi:hypothetical protein